MKSEQKKKKVILESATRVISEKGFVNASISEIAQGAGLAASSIYRYYKSKEELILALMEDFLIESSTALHDHLEGIRGAENKLRKAIWFHCRLYSSNKKTIKILLEVRSYPRFYKDTGYDALKEYAGMFTQIIKEGISDGTFSGLSSPGILRDIILGTVDHIAIHWTIRNLPSSREQAEIIFNLVMDSVRQENRNKKLLTKKDKKKAKIINAATELFAEKGFKNISMLEIAKKVGVAEGTVYEYFRNKENLLISIPSKKLSELYDNVSGDSPERRIKNIIAIIFQFYANEKSYATILVLMLRINTKFYKSEGSRIIENIFGIMEEVIIKGQKQQIFKSDLNMEICRNLFFGTLDHILIPWIMFNRHYDLPKIGKEVANIFVNAIRI